ncbi:hypothetical protein PHEL49_2072 [Polaribacter sp. Hel1_33_49]|nr:hypothetical protein PHEL49_2072 [Polaribacter sp. Hel1_33_49]
MVYQIFSLEVIKLVKEYIRIKEILSLKIFLDILPEYKVNAAVLYVITNY